MPREHAVAPPRPVRAEPFLDLSAALAGRGLIYVGAGWDPEAVILLSLPAHSCTLTGRDAPYPLHPDTDGRFRCRVHYRGPDRSFDLDLEPADGVYSFAQPLGWDSWVLVRARTAPGNPAEENAHFYDGTGQKVGALAVGDGIEDVQGTLGGAFWVGYFDEGVFGDSLGVAGLARFDKKRRITLRFNSVRGDLETGGFHPTGKSPLGGAPLLDACYAMNAVGENAWVYYYGPFPVVRLRGQRVERIWRQTAVAGAGALAVDAPSGRRPCFLFAGSYHNKKAMYRVRLGRRTACEELRPLTADGETLSAWRAFGRGPYLYYRDEQGRWLYRYDVRKL